MTEKDSQGTLISVRIWKKRLNYLYHVFFCVLRWPFWSFNTRSRSARLKSGIEILEAWGHLPLDQKFRKFRVGEWMKKTLSGISLWNFGCTLRGRPKIQENRNNRKIPSIRPFLLGPFFLHPSLEIEFNLADPQTSNYNINALSNKRLKHLILTLLQWIALNKL